MELTEKVKGSVAKLLEFINRQRNRPNPQALRATTSIVLEPPSSKVAEVSNRFENKLPDRLDHSYDLDNSNDADNLNDNDCLNNADNHNTNMIGTMASNSRSNSHTISFDYVSATLGKLRSHNGKDADVKISFEAFRFIQNATEDYLIKLMTMAQKLACHTDMQMVRERDLRLAQELTQIWAGGVERFSYPQPNLGEEGIEGAAADDEHESSEMMTNYDERVDSGASDSEEDIWTAQDIMDGLRKGRDDEDKSPKMTTSGDMSVHSETPGLGVGFIWDDLNGQWKEWAGGPYYKTDTDGVSLSGVSSDSRTMDVEENDRPEYGLLPPSDKDDEESGPHNSKKRPFNFDDEDEDDDDDEDYEDVQGDESDEDDGDDEDDENDWDDEDNDLLRPTKRLRLWEQEELDRRTFMNHHPLAPSAPKR